MEYIELKRELYGLREHRWLVVLGNLESAICYLF